MNIPHNKNTQIYDDVQTLLITYERLLFEIKLLNDELNKHIETSISSMNDMNVLLQNSQKYYYIIMRHLYQDNI